jgi:hypothetical protein
MTRTSANHGCSASTSTGPNEACDHAVLVVAEEREALIEALGEGIGSEDPEARRSQLEGQGEAVQAAADLGHRRGVVVGQLEAGWAAATRSERRKERHRRRQSRDQRIAPRAARPGGRRAGPLHVFEGRCAPLRRWLTPMPNEWRAHLELLSVDPHERRAEATKARIVPVGPELE